MSSPMASGVQVQLAPTPGFVIKSVAATSAVYVLSAPAPTPALRAGPSTSRAAPERLEPTRAAPRTLTIPAGIKVFLNIAWDAQVPPPPPGASEDVIRRAMMGEDMGAGVTDGAYFVPVVVSEPREDKDKSGKPSVVFDCIFNSTLKSRATKDAEFRRYITELALEHVEEKARVELSRMIGTPNIASKGKLAPRTVTIPRALYGGGAEPARPLVQEVTQAASHAVQGEKAQGKDKQGAKPKSILKNAPAKVEGGRTAPLIEEISSSGAAEGETHTASGKGKAIAVPTPRWHWTMQADRIQITIEIPKLTHALHATSTLDLEPRRLLFSVAGTYLLDVDLALPDAQLQAGDAGAQAMKSNADEALRLKRQRDLDVDGAQAKWHVGEGQLVILA